ncbi:dimethyladenosine transferase 1, mitochondrial-like [Physella acuta]|uniref:dimethyladenosine transferase 1, mitochondrial-like n=1 Tax=Physella acuta TaxID=109671 RepID=UPI0027DE1D98|nr:dimethyladenosine transferase 1, mitochondrial-like [Physella acuta]XP_059173800.1 dimethyladenosine transferase 1, mitochondrial-like [Physella acuta]XP_059173801.1 dimethyladenosine transferase 1, mitochondrial-like [Physella acuta]
MAFTQRLPPLPTIQEIIRIYGLRAKKNLSQNFLLDLNLTRKMVKSAGNLNGAFVIEVGPGPGGITRSLINTNASKIVAVEKDRRFMPSLQVLSAASKGRLDVILGDIMDTDLISLIPPELHAEWHSSPPKVHIIGNLPFSIATPLIIQWLRNISEKSAAWRLGRVPLTLTFQKEVAERIVAPPKSEHRCRLSVMCQYLCDVKLQFIIPGKAFVPPPEVDVGIVTCIPKVEPLIQQPFKLVEKVNRHLFHLPNKYFTKTLSTLFPLVREDLCYNILETTGLDPKLRAFEMTMEDIRKVCDAYAGIIEKEPQLFEYDFRSKVDSKERRYEGNLILALEEKLMQKREDNSEDSGVESSKIG